MGKMALEPQGAALMVPKELAALLDCMFTTGWLGRKGARCCFLLEKSHMVNWSQQINCSGRWSRTAHFKTLTLLLVPFQGHHHREECRRFYGDSSEKRLSHSLLVDIVQPESEEHECSMENLLWMKRSDTSHFYNLEHLFIINPGIECMINS